MSVFVLTKFFSVNYEPIFYQIIACINATCKYLFSGWLNVESSKFDPNTSSKFKNYITNSKTKNDPLINDCYKRLGYK